MQEMMKAVSLQARARSLLAKRTLQQARADKEAREAAATRIQAFMRKKLKRCEMKREMKREFSAVLEAARLEQAATSLQRQVRSDVPPLRMSWIDVPPAASASATARSGWTRFGGLSARAQPITQPEPAFFGGLNARAQPITQPEPAFFGGLSARAQPITQPEPAFLAADDACTDWPTSSGRHTYARKAMQMAGGFPASLRQLSPPALLPPPPPPPATAMLDLGDQTTPRFRPWLDPSTRHLYV